jgi:hypothetical protein
LTPTSAVNLSEEAATFSRQLKFLAVSSRGELVCPGDSEISGSQASAAVFKLLQEVRSGSKGMAIGPAVNQTDTAPVAGGPLRFASLAEFNQKIILTLPMSGPLRVLVTDKGVWEMGHMEIEKRLFHICCSSGWIHIDHLNKKRNGLQVIAGLSH